MWEILEENQSIKRALEGRMQEEIEDEPSTSGAAESEENGMSPSQSPDADDEEESDHHKDPSSKSKKKIDPWDLAVAKEFESQKRIHKVGLMINDRFEVDCKIGVGTFGSIFAATRKDTGERVAVKFEYESSSSSDKSHLLYEEEIYQRLSGLSGFPKLHWVGKQHGYNLLIMELLGPNLEQLLNFCNKRFTLRTILSLGEKMVTLLRTFHELGFIHRDVKPANFLIGINQEEPRLYLLDFGLAKPYLVDKRHIEFSEDHHMVGTARYAALNAHHGRELSRRDDLEAVGYVLVRDGPQTTSFFLEIFFDGRLPWSEIGGRTKKQRYTKIKRSKTHNHPDKLCGNIPREFAEYMKYCRGMGFQQTPDYDHILGLFQACRKRFRVWDQEFDWSELVRTNQQKAENWGVLYKWTVPKGSSVNYGIF